MSKVFIDSNILVYTALEQDRTKTVRACQILADLQGKDNGFVSLQVLRELANVLFKKGHFSSDEVRIILDGMAVFPCVDDSRTVLDDAIELKSKYDLQFYDALIIATAKGAGCDMVYSEDMGDGVVYDGITVKDPFKEDTPASKRRKTK
jgi:predicted nucleic acid-binding protein